MTRVLGIELRRSAALGSLLVLLLVGGVLLQLSPGQWAGGWMSLARIQRTELTFVWPLALAAGAWQAQREHRSRVGELFASTARPGIQRAMPTLGALGLAVALAYLVAAAAVLPRLSGQVSYVPAASFAVFGVGLLAVVAAVWLGLAVGRLVPSLLTPPVLAVAGLGALTGIPAAAKHRDWLAMLFSPATGMGTYTDFQTVPGRVSAGQGIWLAALAVTGAALLAATGVRTRLLALLPAVVGAAVGFAVIPHGASWVNHPLDPAAQRLTCVDSICISRVHEKLRPEVRPIADQALAALSKLPNGPKRFEEDTNGFFEGQTKPRNADVVKAPVSYDTGGHLRGKEYLLVSMLYAGGADTSGCASQPADAEATAAQYWLLNREPTAEQYASRQQNAKTLSLWQGLRALPAKEAAARVGAVRAAAMACKPLDGLLS